VKVYLSSTLNDLGEERLAIKDVFSGDCIVKESYKASEQELVESCLADVAECDLYVGVVGMRYGFTPDGGTISITQLEYEEAGRRSIPRLIFLKDPDVILAKQTDADWQDPDSAIARFRKRVADDQRPAMFATSAELKIAVQKAFSEFKARRAGAASLMSSRQRHPWEYRSEVAFGCVPGTDDALRDSLSDAAAGDRRIELFPLSPADPGHYLAQLDRHARRTHAVVLPVSAASLPRLNEQRDTVCAAVRIAGPRAPIFALLAGVTQADLDPAFAAAFAGIFETPAHAWGAAERMASLACLQRRLRERLPEWPDARRVGIPVLALAPTLAEAVKLCDDATLFERFGDGAELRRKAFAELRQYLAERGLSWPKDFYGPQREDWCPFGPQEHTVREFVEEAARKSNAAPEGSRERRRLRDQMLVPQWYRFEEYLHDSAGSRDNLAAVCDAGCLVLLDEFALLHAELRYAIEKLVASDNAAVVVLSACDPAHSPSRKVLDDFSHFNLGNLRSRFRNAQDPCCELALNSITRLQRWLRLVLPELWATLGQQQGSPALLRRVDALFEP
jgi:hypothetical protein